MEPQFIVYACPTQELSAQLETYWQLSREQCGANRAHNYMPHCTLTGFFCDRSDSASYYIQALEQAYQTALQNQSLAIEIVSLILSKDWHGLELQANGLKELVCNFSQIETSPSRTEAIRLKDWLHLSLAYGFEPEKRAELEQLAKETINIKAHVAWELRFYQRANTVWQCLNTWTL
ncbi:MAG: hypothetical protein AAF652_12595 [Cyanobacteria bacterium P01_C01_bin.72]